MTDEFGKRISIEEVEEGKSFTPKFDENGLIPVITVEDSSGDILMHGYMNSEALIKSIESREAHYWSRSRQKLWKKGEISGLKQAIVKILVDDDQDCMIFRVNVAGSGASCHVGYKSCFYRILEDKENLSFIESEKLFDPAEVYEGEDNPTIL
ncbi:phosphoribosyl-AMP cyclohydrolase [SAR86 cluster bacterium]|jgi:phosphoribosyl-AMP cyclohydrolase|nr:phosphoribosyl-AMP cyclohydrolase [SAR86 cluster bacterium]|tara:strand:- start:15 stop:473 length:459 start_codon:yes stop_codon:yes gene_type:complete